MMLQSTPPAASSVSLVRADSHPRSCGFVAPFVRISCLVRADLQSARMEYRDLQSRKNITTKRHPTPFVRICNPHASSIGICNPAKTSQTKDKPTLFVRICNPHASNIGICNPAKTSQAKGTPSPFVQICCPVRADLKSARMEYRDLQSRKNITN